LGLVSDLPSRRGRFAQRSMKVKNTLRHIMGKELIAHLGVECDD
jgi:hypothetical protein